MQDNDRFLTSASHGALLLANIAWGMMSPVSKDVLLSETVSPLALSGIRILGGALLFLIFSYLLPTRMQTRQPVRRRDILPLLACSILIISANQGLFILGIGYTNPIDSSVMSALTPLLTMLLAAIFLGFPVTWLKAAGVGIGLAGVILLVSGSPQNELAENPLLGDTLCFTAQLCAAIYYVAFRGLIMRYSPFTMMKWMFLMSAVTYVPICIPDMLAIDYSALPTSIWCEFAYIIVFATFLGYLCIPFAQKHMRPTMVSMYNYLQPVAAAVCAVALGVGAFGFRKAGATLLILIGVYFVNRSSCSVNKSANQ